MYKYIQSSGKGYRYRRDINPGLASHFQSENGSGLPWRTQAALIDILVVLHDAHVRISKEQDLLFPFKYDLEREYNTLIQVIFTNKERLRESGSPLYVGVRKESFDPRPFHHPLPVDGAKEDGCLQSLSIVKSSHNPNQSMIKPCKSPQNIVFCVKISRNAHSFHRQKPVLL